VAAYSGSAVRIAWLIENDFAGSSCELEQVRGMPQTLNRLSLGSAVAASALLAIAGTHALATEFASAYTSTADKACRKVESSKPGEGEWMVQACPGAGGYVIRFAVDDLRTTVSAGTTVATAAKEPAAMQGFRTFNRTHDTVEWRGVKGEAPFAIIQRWRLNDPMRFEDARGAVGLLVVTRLPPGPVCHVAYIDTKANPNANELARQAAETLARDFKCGSDKVHIVGARGRAIELAAPP
jgi:hypothetical protein